MNGPALQVLIVEDDPDYVDIVRLCLDEPDSMGLRFELARADRLELGLRMLESARFDALLLDLTLPDSRGLETIKRVIDSGHEIPILVLTNLGDEQTAFEAMRLGAQDYMVKSTSDSRLLKRAIWYAIERRKLLAQSEAVIKRSPDGMAVVDEQGLVRYVNPAAEALLGRPASGLVGQRFPFEAAPGAPTLHKLAEAGGRERLAEMRVAEILWRGSPARLAVLRDVTDLQRVEQLKAEVKQRRRLDQMKDELIGTVSHELRTPLTIVKGAVDNLRDGIVGQLGGRQAEIVELAHRNLNRLAKMINNLLDLSRLESGRARADRRPVRPGDLLTSIARDLAERPSERGVRLDVEAPDGLPDVWADPELITEVLSNLIDNALRFARTRVIARVRAEAVQGRPRGVVFEVVDDGPGIPAEKIGGLFNKFVQVNRPLGGAGYKGTGLGLAICKEIMNLHGSRIRIESIPGAGSSFSFFLAEPEAESQPAAEAAHG